MKSFTEHIGVAAPLLRPNIDTDAIIPSREMNVSREGLAEGLFAGWRYCYEGERRTGSNPDFVLNRPEYTGASILLAGHNFGCGSSREHAVWALADYGIRAIVAPSFAAIFYTNCVRNGVLPVVLPEAAIRTVAAEVAADPQARRVRIDLRSGVLESPSGQSYRFDLDPADREMLLEGLDPIDLTMRRVAAIDAFEARDRGRRPWAWLA